MTTQDHSGTPATLAGQEDTSDLQELPRGSNLGRYVIIEPIGSGGMGTVYRAYDPQLNRGVALKILSVKHADLGTAERAKARLIREAQALAQLSHPNVVAVHDAGTFEDDVYIAMELVEGKTLDEWMREDKRSVKEILEVMIAAGRGLSAAHKAGLVHRDFKPGNVIVGDDERVRVLDFGLARAIEQEGSNEEAPKVEQPQKPEESFDYSEISSDSSPNLLLSPLTNADGVLGTPMYMAPEQHLGSKTDERTDQFGFCVVLYEALYRQKPYRASTLKKQRQQVINHKVLPPPRKTDVPSWMFPIIDKGLETDPEKRFSSMEEIIRQLENDPEAASQKQRTKLQRRLLFGVLILLVLIVPLASWYGLRIRTVQLCKDASDILQEVWATPQKEAIRSAFLNTKLSYAAETWQLVQSSFDKYIRSWTELREQVCEATWLRGIQSEELLDLKMGCLSKRIKELDALVKIFKDADEMVVQKAVQASASLSEISNCGDEQTLRLPYAPPKDAATKKRVEEIQEGILQVRALHRTGKYKQGLTLAHKLFLQAEETNYEPVRALVMVDLGLLHEYVGETNRAFSTYLQAAKLAAEAQDVRSVCNVLIRLVFNAGYLQSNQQVGDTFAKNAEIILRLIGTDQRLEANLLNNQGIIATMVGNFEQAELYYKQAIELHKKTYGAEFFELGRDYNNLGVVYYSKRDFEKAKKYQELSLEIKKKYFGYKHPSVAFSISNLGLIYLELGQYDSAKKSFEQALQIGREAYGSSHQFIAWPMQGLGETFLRLDDLEQSEQHFEHVLAICEKKVCQPQPLYGAQFGLAKVLWARLSQRNRAQLLAKQARDGYKKVEKRYRRELEAVESWIQTHQGDRKTEGGVIYGFDRRSSALNRQRDNRHR